MKNTQQIVDARSRIEQLKSERAGARKALEEQAKKQVQHALEKLDRDVSEAFHGARALGVSKNEIGRWWGTKNFNTVVKFLELRGPNTVLTPQTVGLPTLENRTSTMVAVDGVVFDIGCTKPLGHVSEEEFWSRPEIDRNAVTVRKFIMTGVKP